MAYDEKLGTRIREVLGPSADEKKMFGGLAFMLRGHMVCGVVDRDLMVRVGADGYEEALSRPHARPMDFTGRPLTGMVYVGAEGIRTKRQLTAWVDRGQRFVATLPDKKKAPTRAKAKASAKAFAKLGGKAKKSSRAKTSAKR